MGTAHKKHKTSKKVTPEKKAVLEPQKQSVTSHVGQPQEAQPMRVAQSTELPSRSAPPVESAPVAGQPVEPAASSGPLTDFKEKMSEEEQSLSNVPPKKNYMWPILFVFIIALALMAGIFIYKQGVNKSEKVNVVSLSTTPTLVPEPTKAKIDLSKYPIKILNGSGISGEASRQKDNLEGEGFTVASIGNADSSDYTDTIIQAKEEVDKDFIAKLKSVLEKSFVVGEIEELPQDADSDVVVILGSETN